MRVLSPGLAALSGNALFACVALLAATACSKPELAPPDKPTAKPEPASPAPAKGVAAPAAPANAAVACGAVKAAKTYGDKPKAQGAPSLTVAKVLGEADKFADKTVLVQGRVRSACTKKGCWMELAESSDAQAAGTRITFKDYGFFVPTTSAGKSACVEGVVSARRVAPEEVAHLEAEGAKFPSKMPDGSAREVRIVATGVDLWDTI